MRGGESVTTRIYENAEVRTSDGETRRYDKVEVRDGHVACIHDHPDAGIGDYVVIPEWNVGDVSVRISTNDVDTTHASVTWVDEYDGPDDGKFMLLSSGWLRQIQLSDFVVDRPPHTYREVRFE